MINREQFFNSVREQFGSLSQSQVDGYNFILDEFDCRTDLSLPMMAYILATAKWETASTMQPIAEYGRGASRSYGKWRTNSRGISYCYKNGSKETVYTQAEYDHLYYGRGYVQLTWWDNYKRMSDLLGVDMLNNPDLNLQCDISVKVMITGMQRGMFTGKKLSGYFTSTKKDYVNARRIINGTDKMDEIARIAEKFERALK